MPPGFSHPAVAPRVVAHYSRCAELLEAGFGGSPIVLADFPRGFHAPPRFRVTDIPLSSARIEWLAQREYAVEFHTWAPLPEEPERLRFGRILLEPPRGERDFSRMKEGALAVRRLLRALGYDAIPLVDGVGGIALWLPFAQAPLATKVRARLQRICARAAVQNPSVLCSGALPSESRIRLDASTNAPGRYSALPYTLRGTPALPVCSPVTWAELERLDGDIVCTAQSWPEWYEEHGDLFASAARALAKQHFRTSTRGRAGEATKARDTATATEG